MTRSKGGRFIKKEKLSVMMGRHNTAAYTFELQHTNEPASHLGSAHNLLVGIMQDPAIAQHGAALRDGY